MSGRYRSLKYCKNHPERLSVSHRNVCKECFNESQRKTWHEHKITYNSRRKKKLGKKDLADNGNKFSDYGFMFRKVS